MNLKILIAFLLAVVAIVASYVTIRVAVAPELASFAAAERQALNQETLGARLMIMARSRQLGNTAADWAIWTDTYRYIAGTNPEFAPNNLDPEGIDRIGLDFMAFFDAKRRPVHVLFVDSDLGEPATVPPGFLEVFDPSSDLLDPGAPATSGLAVIDGRPASVAIQRISDSDQALPPNGTLVVGQYLDAAVLHELSALAGKDVMVKVIDSVPEPENKETLAELLEGSEVAVHELPSGLIEAHALIKDVRGQPTLIMSIQKQLPMSRRVEAALRTLTWTLMLGAGFTAMTSLALVYLSLLRPIERIGNRLRSIRSVRDRRMRVPVSGPGSIRALAHDVNRVLSELRETTLLVDSLAGFGVIMLNRDGSILEMNATAADLFAEPSEEHRRFYIAECDAERGVISEWAQILAEASSTGRLGMVRNLVRHDGSTFLAQLTIAPLNAPSAEAAGRLICVVADITEQQRMEDRLQQARKLESIGSLAAGIAHEINTPIQFVGDNARFFRESFNECVPVLLAGARLRDRTGPIAIDDPDLLDMAAALSAVDLDYLLAEVPAALDESLSGIERVAEIVKAMKAFSHPGSQEMQLVNLATSIDNAVAVAMHEWKYVAQVHTEFGEGLDQVACHPGEINQVLLNLIVNSAHAIGDRDDENAAFGEIRISAHKVDEFVEVRVKDNGCGIPDKVRDRIFDPFFTTKEVGRGTGQGLAIARDVIENKHGGAIEVISREGEGTEFILRWRWALPGATDSVAA